MTPFPGTPLYDRLLAEGRLLEPTAPGSAARLFDVNFRPRACRPTTLQHERARARRGGVYTEDERAARRQRFHDQRRRHLRETREARKVGVPA